MIEIDRQSLSTEWLRFVPVRMLYEFDGPRIFTCQNVNGQIFLAYQCDEAADVQQFLVVPFTEELVGRLVKGHLSVRDALLRSPLWLFEVNNEFTPIRCWTVEFGDLPKDALPRAGTLLWANLNDVSKVQIDPSSQVPTLTGTV